MVIWWDCETSELYTTDRGETKYRQSWVRRI